MQHALRLTRSDDFEAARRLGRSYSHRLMVVVARPNESLHSRVGVLAGRAVGNAVKRNRAKRVLRASVRGMMRQLSNGWDVVLIARRPLLAATHTQAVEALTILLRRARVVI